MKTPKLIALLLSLSMIFSLAACSSQAEPAAEAPSSEETIQVEETPQAEAPAAEAEPIEEPEPPVTEEAEVIPPPDTRTGINMFLSETEDTVTFIDGLGNEQTVHKNPERVVVIKGSFLEMWYMVGGTAIARTNETIYGGIVPEDADMVDLGGFSQVSAESILALNPDLAIISVEAAGGGTNGIEMQQLLTDAGVEYIGCVADNNPYENTLNLLYLFSKLLGTEEKYKEIADDIQNQIDDTLEKYKDMEAPTFAVLMVSPSGINMRSNANQVAEILSMLGGVNILEENDLVASGATSVAFSMEEFVSRDPQFIFIQTYLSDEAVKEQVGSELENQAAWNELTAVKEGHVIYVPSSYSLSRLNNRYGEAIDYFADILYNGGTGVVLEETEDETEEAPDAVSEATPKG